MNVLIDAHIPRRAAGWFRAVGCDAVHTLDMPNANRTPDDEVTAEADREDRVVVTKDADFVSPHLLSGRPAKLLLISTGNISNPDLESSLLAALPDIVREFQLHRFLELGRSGLVVRG